MTDGIPPIPPRVAVIGAGTASSDEYVMALSLGRAIASLGGIVVCGGRGGVMEAVSKGVAEAGGTTVGFLPGGEPGAANPWITVPLPTGMGHARNALVAASGEAVIAVGGSWGTLSEIALARTRGIEVATLLSPPAQGLGLPAFATAEEAAHWAVDRAWAARRAGR